MRAQNSRQGFSLVELAIVLVILGLLVGGVLVGQDLIRAAEIRGTVGQVEKFDQAANAFRTKFNGFPGDVRNPANLGLASTNASGANALADGDGLIESGSCSNAYGFGGENAVFWTHLNGEGLIEGNTSAMTDYTAVAALTIGDTHMIQAKLGRGNRFHITTYAGFNHYVLSNFTATTVTTCALTAADALLPLHALSIDEKLDDGVPTVGRVINVADGAAPTAAGGGASNPAAGDCYDSDAPAHYALDDADAEPVLGCQLRIRASF